MVRPQVGAVCFTFLACICGCTQPRPPDPVRTYVVVGDILSRCGETYLGLQTLQARGLLRDYRGRTPKASNIAWDLVRPDRGRLQIELSVALVIGDRWWTYEPTAGRYRSYSQFTRTPMETAAHLMSDGVPFLLPALWGRGERAFGGGRATGFPGWRLEGVEWHAERPCYVVSRPERTGEGVRLRVWIDQDRFLVRGWALCGPRSGERDAVLLGCSYYDVIVNQEVPLSRFALREPQPIELSLPKPDAMRE